MPRRDYQETCIRNIRDRREAGVRRQLSVSATGTGKTVIFGELSNEMQKGAQQIVVAHTEELINQSAEKMAKTNPGASIGIEMAERKADGREDIIVGSVQTLSARDGKRLEKIDPRRVEWLVIDEAHHSTGPSYGIVIDYLMANPFTTLVGFTATPNRTDGVAMGSRYDEIVFQYLMLDAIRDGWLVDVHGFSLKTNTDLSGIKTRDGDFNEKALTKAINTVARNERIVKGWLEYLWPRQTIIFTVDIQHALDLTAAFARQGIKVAAVWGDDPERRKKLEQYRRGELYVLINCQLLIEGFDMWQVEAVIPATPTKSQSKLIQIVGRCTRLQEGIGNLVEWRKRGLLTDADKQNCVVMDPIDLLGRHSLATLPSLFGLPPKMDLQGASGAGAAAAIKSVQARYPNADLSALERFDELESFASQADLWQVRFAEEVQGFSQLQWTKRGDGSYRILLPRNEFFRVEEDMVGKFNVEGTLLGKNYRAEKLSSLADAVRLVEQTITKEAPDHLVLLGREEKWMKEPVSKGQLKILKQLRVPDSQVVMMTRGQAAAYITSRFNRKG